MAAFTVFLCCCGIFLPEARCQQPAAGWGSEWNRMVGAEQLAGSPFRKQMRKAIGKKDLQAQRQIIDQWQKATPGYFEPLFYLAAWHLTKKQPQPALEILTRLLKNPSVPANARLYILLIRANVLQKLGRSNQAVADYEEVNRHLDSPIVRNDIAWLLATCPDPAVRNGNKALEFALAANQKTGGREANVLDTVAAAYAENGDFAQAIAFQKKANQSSATLRKKGGGDRLKLYEKHQPYRDELRPFSE